ncbi:MAG: hypothetical protein KDH96_11855 [Candidatus Riesia sp.]|nr:hypothetical protein [Candidatus Riesia sp.]
MNRLLTLKNKITSRTSEVKIKLQKTDEKLKEVKNVYDDMESRFVSTNILPTTNDLNELKDFDESFSLLEQFLFVGSKNLSDDEKLRTFSYYHPLTEEKKAMSMYRTLLFKRIAASAETRVMLSSYIDALTEHSYILSKHLEALIELSQIFDNEEKEVLTIVASSDKQKHSMDILLNAIPYINDVEKECNNALKQLGNSIMKAKNIETQIYDTLLQAKNFREITRKEIIATLKKEEEERLGKPLGDEWEEALEHEISNLTVD